MPQGEGVDEGFSTNRMDVVDGRQIGASLVNGAIGHVF